jgi:hypothetical protein
MSLNSYIQLPQSLSVDSRLLINPQQDVQVKVGAKNFTINRQTAQALSNSQLIWNVVLNDKTTVIDPYIMVDCLLNVTVGATAGLTGAQNVMNYVTDYFAPRAWPLNSVTSNCIVKINNEQISSNNAQYIHAAVWDQNYLAKHAVSQSITPTQPDMVQYYSQAAGSLKSPLLSYLGSQAYTDSRGSFLSEFNTITNGATGWNFTWRLREPILSPVFDYDCSKPNRQGLPYINQLTIQLQLYSNLSKMFSLDLATCPLINNITVNITSAELVMNWLTPPPLSLPLPPVSLRSFNTVLTNANNANGVSFAPGQTETLIAQAIDFSQIPNKILIYLWDQQQDIPGGYQYADAFFRIENINIQFNNVPGLVANYSPHDLYNNFQVEENTAMTYIAGRYFTGNVLVIDTAKVLSLNEDQAPGTLGRFLFQVQVRCTNISNRTITPTLYITQFNDTILETTEASVTRQVQGFLTPEDVLNAKRSLPPRPTDFTEKDIYGGGFLDDLKNFAAKAFGFVKDNKLLSHALSFVPHPAAYAASRGLAALGYGGRGGKGGADYSYPYNKYNQYGGAYVPRRDLVRYNESLGY